METNINYVNYFFEIKSLIRAFISAIDGAIINRYHDTTRAIADRIKIKYIYSPKQKVVEDLVNKGANIQLPAVAIVINSIERDKDRVFNKILGIQGSQGISDSYKLPYADSYAMPVPIKISLSMSILAKFQTDIDQIVQNFLVNCNPYFILSWQLPPQIATQPTEIRSKCIWSESVKITVPVDINAETKSHIEADTDFTIEGWLFLPQPTTPTTTIYTIVANFIPVDGIYDTLSLVDTLSAYSLSGN